MSKLTIFKPKHFEGWAIGMRHSIDLSNTANEILNQYIAEHGFEAYGWLGHKDKTIWHPELSCYKDAPERKAIIIPIQEIKKQECEHEQVNSVVEYQAKTKKHYYECSECKQELKSKGWEVVSED